MCSVGWSKSGENDQGVLPEAAGSFGMPASRWARRGQRACWPRCRRGQVPIHVDRALVTRNGLLVVAEVAVGIAELSQVAAAVAVVQRLGTARARSCNGRPPCGSRELGVEPADVVEDAGLRGPVFGPLDKVEGAVQVAEGVGGDLRVVWIQVRLSRARAGRGDRRSVRTARVSAAGAGTRRRTGRIRAWPRRGSTARLGLTAAVVQAPAALSAVVWASVCWSQSPDGGRRRSASRPVARSTREAGAGRALDGGQEHGGARGEPGQCAS